MPGVVGDHSLVGSLTTEPCPWLLFYIEHCRHLHHQLLVDQSVIECEAFHGLDSMDKSQMVSWICAALRQPDVYLVPGLGN